MDILIMYFLFLFLAIWNHLLTVIYVANILYAMCLAKYGELVLSLITSIYKNLLTHVYKQIKISEITSYF